MMKSNYIFTITTGNSGRGRFEKNSVAQGVCSGGPYIMLVVYIHCQLAHGFVSTHAPVNNKPIRLEISLIPVRLVVNVSEGR